MMEVITLEPSVNIIAWAGWRQGVINSGFSCLLTDFQDLKVFLDMKYSRCCNISFGTFYFWQAHTQYTPPSIIPSMCMKNRYN